MRGILQGFLSITFGVIFALFLLVVFSLHPQPESPYSYETTSTHYSISDKQAIRRSVNSAVRVVSMDIEKGAMSSLSGTYFVYHGKYYILTSAHGIVGSCKKIFVMHLDETSNCKDMIVINRKNDYAIFEVEEMFSRKAISIPRALPNWRNSYNILDKIYYTGYPNSIGPTTWTGNISGFTGDYIIVQSYAWSGASGSGIFDEKGELIGIIMALDVGSNEFGYQVLNNFLVVVPIWQVDFDIIME